MSLEQEKQSCFVRLQQARSWLHLLITAANEGSEMNTVRRSGQRDVLFTVHSHKLWLPVTLAGTSCSTFSHSS
ncbi:uncharacterized protein V6R79_022224 [Siganus canaliculatus]